jgi:hypothetical protein
VGDSEIVDTIDQCLLGKQTSSSDDGGELHIVTVLVLVGIGRNPHKLMLTGGIPSPPLYCIQIGSLDNVASSTR